MKEIRSTYDGLVEVAIDYMVFNVTKDDIRVRMAASRRRHLAAAISHRNVGCRPIQKGRLLGLHQRRPRRVQGCHRLLLRADQQGVRHGLQATQVGHRRTTV